MEKQIDKLMFRLVKNDLHNHEKTKSGVGSDVHWWVSLLFPFKSIQIPS